MVGLNGLTINQTITDHTDQTSRWAFAYGLGLNQKTKRGKRMIVENIYTKKRYKAVGFDVPLPHCGGGKKVLIRGKSRVYKRDMKRYRVVKED